MSRRNPKSRRRRTRRAESRRRHLKPASAKTFRTTPKLRGGITGRGFLPGQSGNPGGRPRSERTLLQGLYGEGGEKVYARLEILRTHPRTSRKLQAQIDFFIIERLHGRARQRVEVEGGASLVELLAAAAARVEG